ncbi:MAG: gluconate 2-dehydrogenase subunit 3 family protein [Geminicoccaceae bacterium]|nr:gluconate 2-dehydrogenase subunit 3 family protein [Geminicoccaceae bacterium]
MSITVHARAPRGEAPPRLGRRIRLDRRRFLASGLTAVGAYVVAFRGVTWIVGPGKAWAAGVDTFEPELADTLLKMTRALYPHDFLGDVHYAQVVQDLDGEVSGFDDKERLQMLRGGMAELDEAAGGTFVTADAGGKQAALGKIAGSPFFEAVRSKTVVSLYNQPEVWKKFGYEGPSYDEGGYLHRGFDDLSWLPDPPAEASPPVQAG